MVSSAGLPLRSAVWYDKAMTNIHSLIENIDPEKVAFSGDWHGNLKAARKAIRYAAKGGAEVLIQVGDFGVWEPYGFIRAISDEAKRFDMLVLVTPGNHEDYDYLDSLDSPVLGNVIFLPRGFRWSWSGVSFLAVGGAGSRDRTWRLDEQAKGSKKSWWVQEYITDLDVEKSISGGPVDVLISHDAPLGYGGSLPIEPRLASIPDDMLFKPNSFDVLLAEVSARQLEKIFDYVLPSTLVHGHFHVRHTGEYKGCTVESLGRDRDILPNVTIIRGVTELA